MPSLHLSLLPVRFAFKYPRPLRPVGKSRARKVYPLVEEGQVREPLHKVDIYKSVVPDRMHSQLLRELANVIAGPLLLLLERS